MAGTPKQKRGGRSARPAIRLRGVRKAYRLYDSFSDQALDVLGVSWLRFWRPVRHRTFVALDGIDLEVAHGERVGIVGRNGAGKTTLLKLITGNFAPTAGVIEVGGDVQALMQSGLGFHGEFTGLENIKASLVYNGLSGDELAAGVEDVIEFCELGDFLHQPVKTYSLGMRARLQFAAATAIKPDIVIIDEVLGAGDAYFAGKCDERIRKLTGNGATLLIVSHSMHQILQFSDRAVWIDRGRIMTSGKPLDVVNQYEEFIYRIEQEQARKKRGLADATSSSVDIPQWLLEKSETGSGRGSDWGGSGPLRIEKLSVVDAKGAPVDVIGAGQPFGLAAEVVSDRKGTFRCSCAFVVYGEAGEIVARIVEPERDYVFGAARDVCAWIENSPVGQGEYVLSAGLYRGYDPAAPSKAHRYHIRSRGYQFRITSARRDNSRILLAPAWEHGPRTAPRS